MAPTTTITEDEANLYDRQIRLWGLEAQQKLRNARILVITLRALGTETVKNLVLAGIGSLTIMDDAKVIPEDLGAQFFLREDDIGKNRIEAALERIQNLNPRVQISIDVSKVSEKKDIFFKGFNLICATDLDYLSYVKINNVTRTANIPFYISGISNWTGYIFADLIKRKYYIEKKETTKNGDTTIREDKIDASYVDLASSMKYRFGKLTNRQLKRVSPVVIATRLMFAYQANLAKTNEKSDLESLKLFTNTYLEENGFEKSYLQDEILVDIHTALTSNPELSPVAAIVGGVLAQDILNVLAGKEPPISNWFGFDGRIGSGILNRMA